MSTLRQFLSQPKPWHGSAFLALSLLFLSGASLVRAQEFRATLSGIVRDPSGAVVPKASVRAVKKDSGQTDTAVTNDQGFYSIPYLLPGNYEVTVLASPPAVEPSRHARPRQLDPQSLRA